MIIIIILYVGWRWYGGRQRFDGGNDSQDGDDLFDDNDEGVGSDGSLRGATATAGLMLMVITIVEMAAAVMVVMLIVVVAKTMIGFLFVTVSSSLQCCRRYLYLHSFSTISLSIFDCIFLD